MPSVKQREYDVVVVGAGPNGLAAAIVIAQAGLSVVLVEANETIGGGARTAELTLPGFRHDICSAIHPMSLVSPFLRSLPLAAHGLEWRESPMAIAHPLDDGSVVTLEESLERTCEGLGADGEAWRGLMGYFVRNAMPLFDEILRPIRLLPPHPFLMARFGLTGLRSARAVVQRFGTARARALFGGCAAHSFLPLDAAASASFGLALALAGHAVGWPCARGGSESIIRALGSYFDSLGGETVVNHRVRSLADLPASRAVIFDVTPHQLARIASDRLPQRYLRRLQRFRYGPGVFKVDWALDGTIPWRNPECLRSATVHIGGTFEEIAAHEAAIWKGSLDERPFVLVGQQSLFDDSRAPAGKHTGWAYCHVPHGSSVDMTEAIERQMERFAPGFRDRILARRTMNTEQFEAHDENFIGGDIAGGANNLLQFVARPFPTTDPYSTPDKRLFLGSSSTPPGGGVHGMCGYWAARRVLARVFGR